MRKLVIPLLAFFLLLAWAVPSSHEPERANAAPEDKLSYALSVLTTMQSGQSRAAVVANGAAAGLSLSGGGSLQTDPNGRVLVSIRLTDTSPGTINALMNAGATVVSTQTQFRSVVAYVALQQLNGVAALPAVQNIRELLRPGTDSEDRPSVTAPAAPAFACGTPSGNAISQGNAQLNANAARTTFGVNGSGVKVGVESDSYNAAAAPVTTPAQDVTTDDLPGPGNPCGFTTANQILQDCPLLAGCVDEGRAMMQIIHDLAPGATMAFASPNNEADFAVQLTAMQAGGARVFSDDLNFFEDPFYQEGPIGVAAGNAKAAGMLSFTSAGNMNSTIGGVNWNGYETGAYRPMACPAVIPAGHDCHNFGTAGAPDNTYGFTTPAGFNARPILQWAEPRYGVTTDLDYYLLNAAGTAILRTSASTNTGGGGTQFPYEFWSFQPGVTTAGQIVVARRTATPNTPRFKIVFFRTGGITTVEYTNPSPGDTVGHMIIGHHCSQNMISLAATDGATAGTTLEDYSGFGPCTFYFGPVLGAVAAAPIVPLIIPKPEAVASDCVSTTFFLPPPGPPYLFCGTSASSPHGAALAALLLSFKPAATPLEIQHALLSTTVPMAGTPDQVGNGRLNALAAMNALAAGVATPPAATKSFAPNSVAVNTDSVLSITVTNANATPLTAVGFTDNFPAGLVISPTPALTNTCAGTPTATAGTAVLSLTGGTIAANSSCSVTVAVRSATAGSYPNTTGSIASSGGTGTAANATLTVTGGGGSAPTATKSFTPGTVVVGTDASMNITLTNPGGVALTGVSFTDTFPAGMFLSPTPGVTNTCGGTVVATPGTALLSLSGGTIAANGSCTILVSVRTNGTGTLTNSTGPIASSGGAGVAASGNLIVQNSGTTPGAATPTMTPTPVPPPTPFIPLFIPQQQQNPFAIAAILGAGLGGNNTNNAPPPPPRPAPVVLSSSSDGSSQPAVLVLRPPNTGDAGLKVEEEVLD